LKLRKRIDLFTFSSPKTLNSDQNNSNFQNMKVFKFILFCHLVAPGPVDREECAPMWSEKWTIEMGNFLGKIFQNLERKKIFISPSN